VAGDYDEEALLQSVLEASKAEEDQAYPGYSDAIALTGNGGRAPPPRPLPPHVRPVADYEGQEVPLQPGIPRRRCDHPHGVVINPPPQP
jgi:hypothetical protein